MLSDNDRETIATVITFITGATFVTLGIIGTLHYGWLRTLALAGTGVLFFAVGCTMAYVVTRPLRRRTPQPATTRTNITTNDGPDTED